VLLDGQGRECDEGEVALRLTPRPLGLMQGYADDSERTKRAMASGFYRTGDEARLSGKIRRVELRKREAEQRARGERRTSEFWLDDA
jgi:non-ribosomal peptide synthetase component E (peptide arylation enzyme)